MEHSDQVGELAEALAKAQAQFTHIGRQHTGQSGNRTYQYADLADTLDATRKLLTDNGIAVAQGVGFGDGAVLVTTMLLHKSGQWIRDTLALPCGDHPQKAGAAVTYGRRHGLQALVCIAAESEDDAASAQPRPAQTEAAPPAGVAEGDLCPVHKLQWLRRIGTYKEGHQRAGQQYDFWTCPAPKDAQGKFCQQRPPEGYNGPQPAEGEVPSEKPKPTPLSAKAKSVLEESKKLFTRPAASPGGLDMTNGEAWRGWLNDRFGIDGAQTLAGFSDGDLDAMVVIIREHAAGELYDWKPASADGPWEDQ